jgi:hydrogenase maturation protease
MTAPLLVFGWGNPSRGDDALGPLFVERIAALRLPEVECLTDFQLQIEHALDLRERKHVLFVDASADAAAPFAVSRLQPSPATGPYTHALAPSALLHLFIELWEHPPPSCYLLAIRGERFELGTGLSTPAQENLAATCEWAVSRFSALADTVNLSQHYALC